MKKYAWYVRHSKPRFGTEVVAVARDVMTDEFRNDLRIVRGFSLAQHEAIRAEPARLEVLNIQSRCKAFGTQWLYLPGTNAIQNLSIFR